MSRSGWIIYGLATAALGFLTIPGLELLIPFRTDVVDEVSDVAEVLWTEPSLASASTGEPTPTGPSVALSPAPTPTVTTADVADQTIPKRLEPVPKPEFFNGINVLWYTEPGEAIEVVRDKAAQVVEYSKDLGANSMMISIPLFMNSLETTEIGFGSTTPRVNELAILVREAKGRGLYIALRPLVDEQPFPEDEWRGTIEPSDVDAWFDNYATAIKELADTAELIGINELVVGAELSSMGDYKANWRNVERAARARFSGELSYSNNWDLYTHSYDYTGVDAYFRINLPSTASIDELQREFEIWYDRFIADKDVPADQLVLHEVGIPPITGIYPNPWHWTSNNALSHQTQVRWFAAACRAAKEKEVGGIYYWKLDFHQDFDEDTSSDRTGRFTNKPGEQSIRECFAQP